MNRSTKRFYPVLHPLLFGIFPVLFLYSQNRGEMFFAEILWPLGITACITLAATVLPGLFFKNYHKSGLATSLAVFCFFSYGRLADLLRAWKWPAPQLVVLLFLAGIAAAGIILVIRTRKNLQSLTRILNFAAAVLVVIQVFMIGAGFIKRLQPSMQQTVAQKANGEISRDQKTTTFPDIYYIVVDGYGRLDTLAEFYHYDNSAFIRFLEETGFKVFTESRSNYCQTLLSLSATLNMDYIGNFLYFNPAQDDRTPLVEKLRHNRVFDFLKPLQYSIVAFSSGYGYTEMPGADIYIRPRGTMSEFQNVLLAGTILSAGETAFDRHRRRITYILNTLPAMETGSSPRFVFAHLVCPHPPFVFGADGEPVESSFGFNFFDGTGYLYQGATVEDYRRDYVNQLQYLNKLLIIAIRKLIDTRPGNPPVIILQADHGPGAGMDFISLANTNTRDRFAILNALYLPGFKGDLTAVHSSPVNTFRLVLSYYCGANTGMLPPASYYSTWYKPFAFTDVTAAPDK